MQLEADRLGQRPYAVGLRRALHEEEHPTQLLGVQAPDVLDPGQRPGRAGCGRVRA
jgi:hypothetical protein